MRARGQLVTMRLEWRSAGEWRSLCEQAGLRVVRIFAGFEGQVLEGDLPGDHAFVCERA